MNSMQKADSSSWPNLLLPTLSVTIGMQCMRAFLAYLQYLLGDRLGLGAVQLGLVALAVFATGFLAAWLNKKLGLHRLLLILAGGLGLTRLLAQFWPGDPALDFVLVSLGTALFLIFLPTYLSLTYWQGFDSGSSHRFAQAILLGLALDTALHGTFLTYDFIWQAGVIPLALAAVLVATQWLALWALLKSTPTHPAPIEGALKATLPWLAIGPFLFLQLLVFQNQAHLSPLTGWSLPMVFWWVLIGQLLALTLATLWQPGKIGTAIIVAILLIALWPTAQITPIAIALLVITGQLAAGVIISVIIRRLGANVATVYYTIGTPLQPKEGIRGTSAINGASMVLLVLLIFAYYVPFRLSVPYQNSWLPLLAGAIIGVCGVGATRLPHPSIGPQSARLTLISASLLLLFPLYLSMSWSTPALQTPQSGSVRVMTYNVHNGFNTQGQLDMEALAQVIEAQQPDVVALQEVSRGWVVNGSLDMAAWLGQRLGMAYVFAPSSDALWGQVVFSRYPVLAADIQPLPPGNLPLNRSFLYTQIDVGQPAPLQLLNTHLHQAVDSSDIRAVQVETILNYLANRPFENQIITGDLNATPNTPEIELLYAHRYTDVVTNAKLTSGYTFSANAPHKRLDYILISPNLDGTNVVIPRSTASDHLGIVATISINPEHPLAFNPPNISCVLPLVN